ncbi:MAG: major facilitator superfamily 1 [Thermoleophilia bacterium]|nr:major facilitator superfamily 1 [Thermoleophilia bacterium]
MTLEVVSPSQATKPLEAASSAARWAAMQARPGWPFATVAITLLFALSASTMPTPLYGLWQERWGFSPLSLTEVYAVYAIGVLVALVLAGGLSDAIGRRPVILAALVGLLAASGLFLLADGLAWLYAARGLQGLATGLFMSAGSAALIDLHPRRDGAQAGFVNGLCGAGALGLGGGLSGLLVQYAPDPRQLIFFVFAAMMLGSIVAIWRIPETVERLPGASFMPKQPHVPRVLVRTFALASLAVAASWSVGGLYFSLGPALVRGLLDIDNRAAGGLFVLGLCAAGFLAQVALHHRSTRTAVVGGAATLTIGSVVSAIGVHTEGVAPFLIGSVLVGFGFGGAFMGALRSLAAELQPGHRASVMSAFFVVAYGAISLPAVAAGIAVQHVALDTVAIWFGLAVGAVAAVVAVVGWFELAPTDPAA